MSGERLGYLSYLVRLWRDDDQDTPCRIDGAPSRTDEKVIWRASLESALTGKRQSFASLDDLFAFLRRETGAMCEAENDEARAE
jgi:hypothetical protein